MLTRFGLTEDDINSRCYRTIDLGNGLTTDLIAYDSLYFCKRYVNPNNSDHGSNVFGALLEIAPKATYYIANLTHIRDLHNVASWLYDDQNVDVINTSFGVLWEGPSDGTTWHLRENPEDFTEGALNAVNDAVENGTIWVTGAGNGSGQIMYFGPFLQQSGSRKMMFRHQLTSVSSEFNTLSTTSAHKIMIRWEDDDHEGTDLNLFRCPTSTCDSGVIVESQRIPAMSDRPIEIISVSDTVRTSYLKVCVKTHPLPDWVQLGIFNDADARFAISSKFHSILNPAESANPV